MARCDWGRRPAGPVQQVAENGIVAPSGLRESSGAEHQRCLIGLVVFLCIDYGTSFAIVEYHEYAGE